eukprot:maker-scaffold_5-snap-gene-5.56-mRNA-1 protein AED:0.00 eAED:0.00 QI:380/1/1/1/1/1/3/738/393
MLEEELQNAVQTFQSSTRAYIIHKFINKTGEYTETELAKVLRSLSLKTKAHPLFQLNFEEKAKSNKRIKSLLEINGSSSLTVHDCLRELNSRTLPKETSATPFKTIINKKSHPEKYIAFDCEMLETKEDDMALIRVSAVNLKGEAILDILVNPLKSGNKDFDPYVVDYRTDITGISKDILNTYCVNFELARSIFASLISEETFFMGHAVDHDFLALGISAKGLNIIDSSLLYEVLDDQTGKINKDLIHSLEYLTQKVLFEGMSRESRGGVHDSIEDSRNSLQIIWELVVHEFFKIPLDPIVRRPRRKKRRNPFVKQDYSTSLTSTLKQIEKTKEVATQESKRRQNTTPKVKPKFSSGYQRFMQSAKQGSFKSFTKRKAKLNRTMKLLKRRSKR